MSTLQERENDLTGEHSREARDRRLAVIFRPHERIWVVHEQYNPENAHWTIDVVRLGEQERWMRQRYLYDALADIVHAFGQYAIDDETLLRVRREGTIFSVAHAQQPESSVS